jgi:gamma-glutamyltranspeptidase/glutathione hydrolase
MIETIQKYNGTMTLDDLKNYTVSVKEPLRIDFRGHRLFTTEAPSSGAVTFNILKVMEQYPVEDLQDGNLTLHRFVEAMKFAYGGRLVLGDPDFVPAIDDLVDEMLSEVTAAKIRSKIKDNETLDLSEYNPAFLYTTESHGTSHIVVTDASGMTISSTTTVNLLFGAQIMTPETGIIL